MSKNMEALIENLIATGNSMIAVANELKDTKPAEAKTAKKEEPVVQTTESAPAPAKETTISKEDVRKLLVAKSNADGGVHKPAVKALVKKYSTSGQLSAIAPEQYGAVIKELEAIGNA